MAKNLRLVTSLGIFHPDAKEPWWEGRIYYGWCDKNNCDVWPVHCIDGQIRKFKEFVDAHDYAMNWQDKEFYPDKNPPTLERPELNRSYRWTLNATPPPLEGGSDFKITYHEEKSISDPVKTPSHYIDGRKYEPRKVIQDWGLCWELGNALKYIARAGRKGDEAEDLRKAIEYLKYRLEAIDNG